MATEISLHLRPGKTARSRAPDPENGGECWKTRKLPRMVDEAAWGLCPFFTGGGADVYTIWICCFSAAKCGAYWHLLCSPCGGRNGGGSRNLGPTPDLGQPAWSVMFVCVHKADEFVSLSFVVDCAGVLYNIRVRDRDMTVGGVCFSWWKFSFGQIVHKTVNR